MRRWIIGWLCVFGYHDFYWPQPNYEEYPGYWAKGCKRCPYVERLEKVGWPDIDEEEI